MEIPGISKAFQQTLFVRAFGLTKIPMIWSLRPTVLALDAKKTLIKVPFIRANRNHLGSLYLGAFCAGADLAAGLAAYQIIRQSKAKVSLAFKDLKADFLTRSHADTYFENLQGELIAQKMQEVLDSSERQSFPVEVKAFTDLKTKGPVAEFVLTLSLKKRA